ncbi:LacI family DNA-binding transcriptional regulator [Nonomuraea rubra]|uniref:LacI family DNA-binding transcriptional regulator n=1 Tax=Nonomuraea rubra TaxID=46180 RepID=UPI0036130C91
MAREAGVSHVTVSRVLNNHPSVRPETRARVEAAIEKLGYRRNSVARALKSRRSSTIGVVLAGTELYELPRILRGVQTAAQRAGYWVNLASWQGGTTVDLTETLQRLTDQAVEAVAVIADRPMAVDALTGVVTGVPMTVIMSGNVPNPDLGFVELDQELGARLAVRHLTGLGHRHIVHLTGSLRTFDARARVEGWRAGMRRRPGRAASCSKATSPATAATGSPTTWSRVRATSGRPRSSPGTTRWPWACWRPSPSSV